MKITPIMAIAMRTMNSKDIFKMFEESSIVNKISMRGTNKVSAESHWWRWRRGGGGFACVFTQGTAPTCALHHVSMSTCVLKKTLPLDQSESQQFVKKSSQTKQSIGWYMTWNRLSWDSMAICHYVQFQHGLHNWITRICCGYLKWLTTYIQYPENSKLFGVQRQNMPWVWSLDAAGHMCSLNIIWMQLVSSRGKQQIEEIQGTLFYSTFL